MKFLAIAIAVCAALAGCQTAPTVPDVAPVSTTVSVPVAVPCKASVPAKPAFAFDALPLGSDIYTQAKTLLADRNQRKGYEAELEASVQSCQ